MSIERSSLKSFSVVLTSLWPEWLTCLILEHIGLFFCVVFLAQFVPTIGSLSPTCNTKNQYNRIFIQKCLSGTPSHTSPGISWQTRLLDKNQKPQLLSSVGKREVQALPCSYKSDPRATWCPSQCCLGHRCISHCWRPSVAQTPWRFLLGKDFQLRSKGSLNILIFHYSFFFSWQFISVSLAKIQKWRGVVMAATDCKQQRHNCLWPCVVSRWQLTPHCSWFADIAFALFSPFHFKKVQSKFILYNLQLALRKGRSLGGIHWQAYFLF